MRALVQRVRWAEVDAGGQVAGKIEHGLVVYLGVVAGDEEAHADRLAEKVAHLRIFPDDQGKMNLSVRDARGGVLAVPNFTLAADARKGRRPAFVDAAVPAVAERLFDRFVEAFSSYGIVTSRGVFGEHMHVCSQADGPVNIVIDIPDPRDGSGK